MLTRPKKPATTRAFPKPKKEKVMKKLENFNHQKKENAKKGHSWDFKIVQIQKGKESILRFARIPDGCDYHKEIVKRLAEEVGESLELRTSKKTSSPVLSFSKDSEYEIVGAGMCKICEKEKTVKIYEKETSGYYGIGPNMKHIGKIKLKYPDWTFSII